MISLFILSKFYWFFLLVTTGIYREQVSPLFCKALIFCHHRKSKQATNCSTYSINANQTLLNRTAGSRYPSKVDGWCTYFSLPFSAELIKKKETCNQTTIWFVFKPFLLIYRAFLWIWVFFFLLYCYSFLFQSFAYSWQWISSYLVMSFKPINEVSLY